MFARLFALIAAALFVVVLARGDLAALVSDGRGALARGRVVVSHPVAGDLAAVVVDEVEAELVSALELDFLGCEDEVMGLGRKAGGDGSGFLVVCVRMC